MSAQLNIVFTQAGVPAPPRAEPEPLPKPQESNAPKTEPVNPQPQPPAETRPAPKPVDPPPESSGRNASPAEGRNTPEDRPAPGARRFREQMREPDEETGEPRNEKLDFLDRTLQGIQKLNDALSALGLRSGVVAEIVSAVSSRAAAAIRFVIKDAEDERPWLGRMLGLDQKETKPGRNLPEPQSKTRVPEPPRPSVSKAATPTIPPPRWLVPSPQPHRRNPFPALRRRQRDLPPRLPQAGRNVFRPNPAHVPKMTNPVPKAGLLRAGAGALRAGAGLAGKGIAAVGAPVAGLIAAGVAAAALAVSMNRLRNVSAELAERLASVSPHIQLQQARAQILDMQHNLMLARFMGGRVADAQGAFGNIGRNMEAAVLPFKMMFFDLMSIPLKILEAISNGLAFTGKKMAELYENILGWAGKAAAWGDQILMNVAYLGDIWRFVKGIWTKIFGDDDAKEDKPIDPWLDELLGLGQNQNGAPLPGGIPMGFPVPAPGGAGA